MVKIQAFARGVGRQQDLAAAADEGFERARPFLASQAAVQDHDRTDRSPGEGAPACRDTP